MNTNSFGSKLAGGIKKFLWMAAIPVILFVIFWVATPGFGPNSILVILNQSMIPMAIGYGMCFLMKAGMMELSAGAQIILIGIVGVQFSKTFGMPGFIIGCIVTGVLTGLLKGAVFALLRIPSMVISLGMCLILEVIGRWIAGGKGKMDLDKSLGFIGKVPYNFVIIAILGILFLLIFYNTAFGSHVRAIGNNEVVAKSLGIKPIKVKFLCYTVCGFFFGFAAILQVCYSNTIAAKMSMGSLPMVFKPMMGVLIGIELNRIYDNFLVNILVGELGMAIIFNGLMAAGLPTTIQDFVTGFFLLFVMLISANRESAGDAIRRIKLRRQAAKQEG
ncbi:MAG: hypothetical protein IJH53_06305 [Oscillospiraceae bacterium]|nr:hypothetical protein [Oscillospiraceae bacterium]